MVSFPDPQHRKEGLGTRLVTSRQVTKTNLLSQDILDGTIGVHIR